MRVSVDIPEQKSGLDSALAKQFADIQKSLLALVSSQQSQAKDARAELLDAMQEQQSSLVKAMERLLGMMGKMQHDREPSDAMVSALRGLKQTVAELPGDLKDALDKQYQSIQDKTMKVSVKPQVTVEMPKGILNRLDSLESSLLEGMKRSRNRTFGSTY